MFELATPLIDEIDVSNWAIDDIEKLKDFQTNPPSFDAKEAHILEEKQDYNVVFKSLFIEDGIMEIPLCYMISMQILRSTLTNDNLKLQRDFNFGFTLELKFFVFLLRGLMGALLMSPQKGQIVGMIIGKLLMMSLKNFYNPKLSYII